jgi:integrase
MAYIVERAGGFAAYYRDANHKRRSLGIFPTRKEAIIAGERAEIGILPETYINRTTLAEYAKEWLSREQGVLPTTVINYTSDMNKHVLPILGDRAVNTLSREDVEEMILALQQKGVSAHVVARCKAALSSCLRTLVPKVLPTNPAHGVKVKTPPRRNFKFLDLEDARRIVEALPNEGCRMFARFLAATGARYGEACEIRRKDLNFKTSEVEISRRAVDIGGKRNNGSRFRVIDGTKGGVDRGRTIVVPTSFMEELRAWCDSHNLRDNDLVFRADFIREPRGTASKAKKGSFTRGGKTFRHGTTYAYSTGQCRCEDCLQAIRDYRASRSTKTRTNLTGHLGNDQWSSIWKRAVRKADIGWSPRVYDLRHAFATQLLVGGVDIYEVKSLMGHATLDTTLYYLHRVKAQESKAREVIETFIP